MGAKSLTGKAGFEVGDVVRLRGGGPEMTVTKVFGGEVQCHWVCGEHPNADGVVGWSHSCSETYPSAALVLVDVE